MRLNTKSNIYMNKPRDNCSEFLTITLLRRGKQVLLVNTDFTNRTCFPRRNNVIVKNSEQLSLPMRLINNVPTRKLQ
jgi:hypothetical protein